MTKKTFLALEKVFAAEIEGRLPFQSRARIYQDLCKDGLLSLGQKMYGGRFPVVVTGYYLTDAGRIAYCMRCDP